VTERGREEEGGIEIACGEEPERTKGLLDPPPVDRYSVELDPEPLFSELLVDCDEVKGPGIDSFSPCPS
jgi:hypothetical protein